MILDIVTVQKILHHFLGPSERATESLRRMWCARFPPIAVGWRGRAEMFVEQSTELKRTIQVVNSVCSFETDFTNRIVCLKHSQIFQEAVQCGLIVDGGRPTVDVFLRVPDEQPCQR